MLFFGFVAVFVYSSCEKNPCNNVTCFNGGSCNMGICRCPVGWEGPQCSIKSVDRFIGGYVGTTICNGGARIIDTAWVYGDSKHVNFAYVKLKSANRELHGYVDITPSTYSIIVTNDTGYNYLKVYSVTLQNNRTLSINSYEDDAHIVGDTIINKCNFLGNKY